MVAEMLRPFSTFAGTPATSHPHAMNPVWSVDSFHPALSQTARAELDITPSLTTVANRSVVEPGLLVRRVQTEELRLVLRTICAQHDPSEKMEGRLLPGASCHGCTLIAEPSCEMRNDYLDRALVVPIIGLSGAAFFGAA